MSYSVVATLVVFGLTVIADVTYTLKTVSKINKSK